jgi:D-glycerate 3-kinase
MDDVSALASWIAGFGRGSTIGINGCQGSGKTTLALRLQEQLWQGGLQALVLSIDDLYLTRAERDHLGWQVHPLLRTRGVPGTHDVALGLRLLDALHRPGSCRVPRFIKAIDDRAPESGWPTVTTPVDVILFEGWCVATPPQDSADLREPVNALERQEDANGVWRDHVNTRLATDYRDLFARLDGLIFLQAPAFECVHRWRMQQERGNNARELTGASEQSRLMDAGQLQRFIQHYERLTRHALRVMPQRADAVVRLGPDHEWLDLKFPRSEGIPSPLGGEG